MAAGTLPEVAGAGAISARAMEVALAGGSRESMHLFLSHTDELEEDVRRGAGSDHVARGQGFG